MAQADILREFLVNLGFNVDQAGMKRFEGSVAGVTKTVTTLGAAVAATATAVSAAVVKIAANLDNVYFASQRIKASVENLNAFQYAAKQVGSNAASAMGAMNNLASFMRKYPRSGDWFARFGVQTKDGEGNERDRAEVMLDIAKKLRDMPEAKAISYGGFLGMDENFVLALRDGKFDTFFAQYKAMAKDANLKKATEDANKFMTSLRGLIEEFKLLGIRVQAALLGQAGDAMAKFKAWFDDNKPRIIQALTDISAILITIATEVIPVFVDALEVFVKLDAATDGWSTKILALAAAFRVLGGVSVFKFLMGGGALAKAIGTRLGFWGSIGAIGVGSALYSSSLNENEEDNKNEGATKMRAVSKDAGDMAAFFKERGWSEASASGIVANLIHESNLNHQAVGDNGKAYGLAQWHPERQKEFKRVIGKDIRNSSREEQLAFVHYELTQGKEKAAGKALAVAKTKGEAASIVSRKYERPANADAEAAKRAKTAESIVVASEKTPPKDIGNAVKNANVEAAATAAKTADSLKTAAVNSESVASNGGGLGYNNLSNTYNQGKEVTINQNTTINVEGGGDARETARNVVGAQAALNGNLARNMRGAMA